MVVGAFGVEDRLRGTQLAYEGNMLDSLNYLAILNDPGHAFIKITCHVVKFTVPASNTVLQDITVWCCALRRACVQATSWQLTQSAEPHSPTVISDR